MAERVFDTCVTREDEAMTLFLSILATGRIVLLAVKVSAHHEHCYSIILKKIRHFCIRRINNALFSFKCTDERIAGGGFVTAETPVT